MKEKQEIFLATYEETLTFASYLAANRAISEIKDRLKKSKNLQVCYQGVSMYRAADGFYFIIHTDYFTFTKTGKKEREKNTTYCFGKLPEYDGTEIFGYTNYRCCFYGMKIISISKEQFDRKENAEILFCTGYLPKHNENEAETSSNT